MRQQQLDGLGLVLPVGIGRVVDEPPVTGLAQARTGVFAVLVEPPGAGIPVEVVAAVVRHDDLLTEPVVAGGIAAFAFAAPDADERQQGQQGVVEVRAFAQVGGVRGQRQIVEPGYVARGRGLGAIGSRGDGTVAGTGQCAELAQAVRILVGRHDSSVIRRYSA